MQNRTPARAWARLAGYTWMRNFEKNQKKQKNQRVSLYTHGKPSRKTKKNKKNKDFTELGMSPSTHSPLPIWINLCLFLFFGFSRRFCIGMGATPLIFFGGGFSRGGRACVCEYVKVSYILGQNVQNLGFSQFRIQIAVLASHALPDFGFKLLLSVHWRRSGALAHSVACWSQSSTASPPWLRAVDCFRCARLVHCSLRSESSCSTFQ